MVKTHRQKLLQRDLPEHARVQRAIAARQAREGAVRRRHQSGGAQHAWPDLDLALLLVVNRHDLACCAASAAVNRSGISSSINIHEVTSAREHVGVGLNIDTITGMRIQLEWWLHNLC